MSIVLKKGSAYNRIYSSLDFPVLGAGWGGSVTLYTAYPGIGIVTYPLSLAGNTLTLAITIADIMNLEPGVYYFITTISNAALGVTVSMLEYATVSAVQSALTPMTKLYITMKKSDATPAGKQTKTLTNNVNGTTVVLGWKGLPLTITNSIADELSGDVVDTEIVSVETNAAGYVEMFVVKGLTYDVACPGFGKTLTVNTTGLDEIDLSTYF